MARKNDILSLIAKLDTQGDLQAEKIIQKLKIAGVEAVPYLIKSAQDEKSPRIMKWSLLALGSIGDKTGVSVLVKALKHERMTVKLQAMAGLARMNHKASAKKISLLLQDESGGVRSRALSVLIVLNNKSILKSIPPMLKDPMWYIRLEACRACGHFKIESSIPILVKLAKEDERKSVQKAALSALRIMNQTTKGHQTL